MQLAYAIAGQIFDLYGYVDWIAQNATPFEATGEYLAAWAALKGVNRLPATYATGTCTFTGTTGVTVPAGTIISASSNIQYATNGAYVIGSSSPVAFTATTAGTAANASAGVTLTIVTPITGVTSSTTAATAIVGGAAQETDSSLRSNMLQVYANPPNGGSANDYVTWALQVPGCTRAWINPQGYGPGSVVIWVMFDESESPFGGFPQGTNGGAAAENRITSASGDQLLVANYIYPLQPVTALVYVAAPIAAPQDFTIGNLVPNNSTIQAGISAALSDLFVREGSPEADNVIEMSDIYAAMNSVSGITSFNIASPTTQITVPVGSLPTLGTVTYVA